MAQKLLAMIIEAFLPNGPVVIGMDDTIERRWGQKIAARGIYRDPVRPRTLREGKWSALAFTDGHGANSLYSATLGATLPDYLGALATLEH